MTSPLTAHQDWPPERLRVLDRAVAEARGWSQRERLSGPGFNWFAPDGSGAYLNPPEVSLGCRETFALMEEKLIGVRRVLGGWVSRSQFVSDETKKAPTPAIAACLAFLDSEGRPFNG